MKRFLKNLVLFSTLGVLVLCPLIYNKYKEQLPSFVELHMLNDALESDKCVILFGSSVNHFVAPDDPDRRSIAHILDSYLPEQSVTGISHNAYQADIYLEFVKYVARSGKKPIIVIPINLRYFSPEWDMRPGYQFAKERYLLNGYPYVINFKYKDVGTTEFDNFPIYRGDERIGKVKEFVRISTRESDKLAEMRRGFVFNYMQPLDPSHRKLQSLSEICEIGKKNDLKIVMYVSPIDYSHAERLGIRGFRRHQDRVVDTIESTLASREMVFIDLSMALASSYFSYSIRPNEHLTRSGRGEVAKALESAIRHLTD